MPSADVAAGGSNFPLRGGNGKRKRGQSHRVKLNATTYSAPRRKSWSVVVKAEHMDGDGDPVVALYNYNAYGRTAEDVRCAPMPPPVFDLGVQLWLAALPFLCEASRSAAPTHCQLLFSHCPRLFGPVRCPAPDRLQRRPPGPKS